MFREYPLNKVFLEVIDINKEILDVALQLGFKEEAILNEYKFVFGQYCDLHILSLDGISHRGENYEL